MLNRLYYIEIKQTLKQHKSRNVLTGFGVAWGIFVLILLLSAGQGLQNGISHMFSDYAKNSLWIYGGKSSIIKDGNLEGKQINFSSSLLVNLKARFNEIEYLSPEITNFQNSFIYYKDQSQISTVKGVGSKYFDIKLLALESGRKFNPIDEVTERPVCVISDKSKEILFRNENPIGKYINISGGWYKIIGVLSKNSMFNQNDQQSIFITYNCFLKNFNQSLDINVFGILLKDNVNTEKFEKKIARFLSHNLEFDIHDNKAIYILNFNEQVKSFNKLFQGIEIFIWFIGICLLFSGIFGIGNMMLFVVKERTKEIGIRKAVGATPKEILIMILLESIVITTLSGIIGMLTGFGFVVIINWIIQSLNDNKEALISSLSINIPMTLFSLVVLILSGCIAGLIPAKKATEIIPLEALNKEF
jgi:putative ABC transport system permease protein